MQPCPVLVTFSRFSLKQQPVITKKLLVPSDLLRQRQQLTKDRVDHPSVENSRERVVVQKAACADLRNTEALPHLILHPPTTSVISVPLTSAFRPFCYISFTTEDSGGTQVFQFKLADLISVPEQCQRHLSCSPLFTSSLSHRDCLDGTERSWGEILFWMQLQGGDSNSLFCSAP